MMKRIHSHEKEQFRKLFKQEEIDNIEDRFVILDVFLQTEQHVTAGELDELLQQNGFFQAGVLVALADSAGGAASFTLLEENQNILSVNFSVSLMRAAEADKIIAEGKVIKAGQRLHFCRVELYQEKDGEKQLVMAADITMAVITGI